MKMLFQTMRPAALLFLFSNTINPTLAQQWAPTSAPTNYWSCLASSADGTKLIAGLSPGPIYTSTNSGATWTPGNLSQGWSSLASSADGTKLVALVQSASIYTSTNGGASWTPTNPVPGASWRSIASSADGQTLVAAWTGGIEISTNSGATWAPTAAPAAAWGPIACSADGTTLVSGIIPSTHPFLSASTNSGLTWSSNSIPFYCTGVACSADGT